MKKLFRTIIIIAVCVTGFCTNTFATDSLGEIQNEIIKNENLDKLVTGDANEILGDIEVDTNVDIIEESLGVIERSSNYFKQSIKTAMQTMIKITIIIIISSAFTGFIVSNDIKGIDKYINMAAVISITIIVLVDVKSVLSICAGAINEIDILSKGLMPTMVTAISFSGAPTTGTLTYAISMFAFDVLITLINRVLFPFIYVYIAIITVNAAIGNDILIRIADFTTIPVVGSIISDASETILIGANIIKNSIGVFGIFAMVSICIIPAIRIFTNFLMFKITSVLVSPISTKQITNLLDGLSTSFNMALAMISACFLVFFVMIVASIILVRGIW